MQFLVCVLLGFESRDIVEWGIFESLTLRCHRNGIFSQAIKVKSAVRKSGIPGGQSGITCFPPTLDVAAQQTTQ
jgi:hypothetical protein